MNKLMGAAEKKDIRSSVVVIGGTWDHDGGRESMLVNLLFTNHGIDTFNGGEYDELQNILESIIKRYKVVIWLANVPNGDDYPKLRDVKSYHPHCILVMSKRNDNSKYEMKELIKRALDQKANLVIEFSKQDDKRFNMMLFDPLGNVWCNTKDSDVLHKALIERVSFLLDSIRVGSSSVTEIEQTEELKNFFNYVRETADVFHDLLNPAPTTRFLGNSSFRTRCLKGFPTFRSGNGNIYVSKRNIDKAHIDIDGFVPVMGDVGYHANIYYVGSDKPSVDTPVQMKLYHLMPRINYMIHGHVYIEGAPFTDTCIPCGDTREIGEIVKVMINKLEMKSNDDVSVFAINLKGHGCIIGAENPDMLKDFKFVARPMPEVMY